MLRAAIGSALLGVLLMACTETAGPPAGGGSVSPPPQVLSNKTELRVGETKHLTVYLGNSCNNPPSFASLKLPQTSLIRYSDGGTAKRTSRRCGGEGTGRRIMATGLAPGVQNLSFEAGEMSVIVR